MKEFLKYVFATVTGIILVSIVMAILGVISLVGLAASSAATTQVEENSVFTLMLSGQLEERTQENPLASLTGQVAEGLGLDDILAAIKKAKDNENIKGIYIEAGIFSADTPASLHAIREALLDFRKSGKWIVAYSDSRENACLYVDTLDVGVVLGFLDAGQDVVEAHDAHVALTQDEVERRAALTALLYRAVELQHED